MRQAWPLFTLLAVALVGGAIIFLTTEEPEETLAERFERVEGEIDDALPDGFARPVPVDGEPRVTVALSRNGSDTVIHVDGLQRFTLSHGSAAEASRKRTIDDLAAVLVARREAEPAIEATITATPGVIQADTMLVLDALLRAKIQDVVFENVAAR